jgi:hypothetical protein
MGARGLIIMSHDADKCQAVVEATVIVCVP